MTELVCSIVIPAHDEAGDIAEVLERLEPLGGRAEIIVVANGCSDDTAAIARSTLKGVQVLELPVGSKPGALNAGDGVATVYPRLYLDGDVRITPDHVQSMIDALGRDQVVAVGATPVHDVSRSNWIVRSHYRIGTKMTTNQTGLGGANPQMLSREARDRFESWPDVIGDDYFLDGLFDHVEAIRVPAVRATRIAPAGFRDCVSRKARLHAGNVAVVEQGLRITHGGGGLKEALRVVRREPKLIVDFPTHVVVTVAGRLLYHWRKARGSEGKFYRDESRT